MSALPKLCQKSKLLYNVQHQRHAVPLFTYKPQMLKDNDAFDAPEEWK
jgi:hypothetical protein